MTAIPIDSKRTASPGASPAIVGRLAYLALLPFGLGVALMWLVRADAHPHVVAAMSAYAAVVLAFLGGIHWGFGFGNARLHAASAVGGVGAASGSASDTGLYVWGVAPALVACLALLMPASAGLVIHGVMLVVCYLIDRKVYPAQGAGRWLTLRFRLSVGASLACFVAAALV